MIETIIRDYLMSVQTLPVVFEIPAGVKEFYLLEKTGGGEENHIRTASMAVQSYADSLERAAELNEEMIDLMLAAVKDVRIASVDLNSNYEYTDPTTKKYRYQALFEIVYYKEG